MKQSRYASGDFAFVPNAQIADKPECLVHRDLLNSSQQRDEAFSEERRHLVRAADLPSKVLSMTLGGLTAAQTTRLHRHNYETIIYVVSGFGKSLIEDREVKWQAGDALYVPTWSWHQHINCSETESALYVACENAPMLQNLGIALREER